MHSGGTTGDPKIIVLSNSAVNFMLEVYEYIFNPKGEGFDYTTLTALCILPLFHGFGFGLLCHAPLSLGATIVLRPSFILNDVVNAIINDKINFIVGVPSMYYALLRHPSFSGDNIKHIEYSFCGGDVVPEALKQAYRSHLKAAGSDSRILEGYGLTENVTCCAVNANHSHKKFSAGKFVPGVNYLIRDMKTSKNVKTGEEGELCICAPSLMDAYLNHANEEVFFEEDGKRYLRTGDCGYVDEEGYFFFKQRIKRIVIVSGINVYPSEIENHVAKVPGVDVCAAIGVPDKLRGEAVKLFIQAKPDADLETVEAEVKKTCQENLITYAVPRYIEFIQELPKTNMGKMDYKKLQSL
jgi:long-chain acyl-CoA synthetase